MRVIYGSELNVVVDDATSPATIFDTVKQSYPELANGTHTVTEENGERVMRITLRSGSKA